MDWSVSTHQKRTDKQPNREYRRLQTAHERGELRFWMRMVAAGMIIGSLAYLAAGLLA
jgi:hypothetical protein